MENTLNFRSKLNKSKDYAEKIAISRGVTASIQEIAKTNNTFFENFLQNWIDFAISYEQIKKFNDFKLDDDILNDIKKIAAYVKKTFEEKKVEKPITYNNELTKLNSRIEFLWKQYAQSITFEVLEQLGIYALICNNKKSIQEIITNINSINKWPINAADFNKFKGRFEQGKTILLNMNFNSDVENFLKKVKAKQASLLDLTPEVLKWIQDEKLENNIMLSIKTFYQ